MGREVCGSHAQELPATIASDSTSGGAFCYFWDKEGHLQMLSIDVIASTQSASSRDNLGDNEQVTQDWTISNVQEWRISSIGGIG